MGAAPLPDGAALLDDVHRVLTTYCALPSADHEHAVVLWIATTHCLPAFDYAPRLVIRSAEKRSGKSRLLEVVDGMCHDPLRAVHASTAAIFRSLGGITPPTLLLDEADTIFGTKKVAEDNEGLRGLLNAGFQRGLPVVRCDGPNLQVVKFETFAMAALAGIGQMPDTIEDRAVVVIMRRRKDTEHVQPFRQRRDGPVLADMRDQLAEWAAVVLEDLTTAQPDLPVEDRAADTWEPLVSVADAAGGDWPARARQAARVLTQTAEEESSEGSLNMRLLSDIRSVFGETGKTFIKSADLCADLCALEESPWGQFELNPSRLGHRLREYGIKTAHNADKTERGYRTGDFVDAFSRYLATTPSEGVQGVPQAADLHEQPDASKTPDTLKASGEIKVSQRLRRSDGVRTGMDAFGQVDAENVQNNVLRLPGRCPECGYDHTAQAPLAEEWHRNHSA